MAFCFPHYHRPTLAECFDAVDQIEPVANLETAPFFAQLCQRSFDIRTPFALKFHIAPVKITRFLREIIDEREFASQNFVHNMSNLL